MKKILAAAVVALALAGCQHKQPPAHPVGTSSVANIPGTSGYRSP